MKRLVVFCPVVMVGVFVLVISPLYAADVAPGGRSVAPTAPPPAKAPALPVPATPGPKALQTPSRGVVLQAPMKVDPLKLNTPLSLTAMTATKAEWDDVQNALDQLRSGYTSYHWFCKYYYETAKLCTEKAHTIQDQKAAGCVESDTLGACMQKLYNKCLVDKFPKHDYAQSPTKKLPDAVAAAEKMSKLSAMLVTKFRLAISNVPNSP